MATSLKTWWKAKHDHWLERRIPKTKAITLSNSSIFIFPTPAGLGYGLLVLLLLLVAINYQNNMLYGLSFLLASVFVVTILHTYANFSGLHIAGGRIRPGFVGDKLAFLIQLSSQRQRTYFDITVSWPDGSTAMTSVAPGGESDIELFLPARHRGRFRPPRLKVETVYPLGIMRAWSWLDLDMETIVYPRPEPCPFTAKGSDDGEEGDQLSVTAGSDEFYGLRQYAPGDSLKHIAWKNYAKGQSLQSKQFQTLLSNTRWLAWESVSGNVEQRLSGLCYWALHWHRHDQEFGLQLGGQQLQPACNPVHLQAVLTVLALYGEQPL